MSEKPVTRIYGLDSPKPGVPDVAAYSDDELVVAGSAWDVIMYLSTVLGFQVRVTDDPMVWHGGIRPPQKRSEVDRNYLGSLRDRRRRLKTEANEMTERAEEMRVEARDLDGLIEREKASGHAYDE